MPATTSDPRQPTDRLATVAELRELDAGYGELATYLQFAERVEETKRKLLEFLIDARRAGKHSRRLRRAGQGQHAAELLRHPHRLLVDYTVDRNPYKHGKFLPGTHIPIYAPERLAETQPDYILILPWNLKDEIVAAARLRPRVGRKFVVPIPELMVLEG